MSDNSNSDIPMASNKQTFSSLSQNSRENVESNSQDQKKIKIVQKEGSSASELRNSLKHALQILDKMQTDKENEIDENFNRNLNILNSSQENSNLSKSEQLSKPKNYKIIRKKKFVPYRRNENSQDRTEVSSFLETSDKIENNAKNSDKPSNLNFENLQFMVRDIELLSENEQDNVDLDELAKSLGFHLEVSDQDGEGEADTRFVDVSDYISKDSQGNSLSLSDRMKTLGQLITVAEDDLDNLSKTEDAVNNT